VTQTIFCDESGNTGPALLDAAQPVFVLASNNFTAAEAGTLLDIVRSNQAAEAKFSNLKGSPQGARRIAEFFHHALMQPERVMCSVTHKEYMVVSKIVDVIEETLAHRDGLDLYERGANIALANLHFFATRRISNPKFFSAMLTSFVDMVRHPRRDTIERFYYWARRVYESMPEKHRIVLGPILASGPMIREILANNEPRSIDPAVSNAILHCSLWGDRFREEFDVVHDRSKPVYAERAGIEKFMDRTVEPKVIGYDRRKFSFPLRARSLTFADSHQVPQLQVSDLVAGALAAHAVNKISGKDAELAKTLEDAGIMRFIANILWPSPEVDPKKLGTEEVGGINPVEYIAEHMEQRS